MNSANENDSNNLQYGKKGQCDTCERILESARILFAKKSYGNVTVAEICKHANANIAAVNYHFGGKENLYRKAWEVSFERSIALHPPHGGIRSDAPADKRLAGVISALLNRIADKSSSEFNIMINEMANPTGLLQEVAAKAIEPLRNEFDKIISDLLGPGAKLQHVRLCQLSVLSQCIHIMMRLKMSHPLPAGHWHNELDMETLTQHIIDFSLAGIANVRRQIINNQATTPDTITGDRSGENSHE